MGVMGIEQWTPEEDATLRLLIERRKTASQIGAVIGRSRNAVIGRAHRLKLKFFHPSGFDTPRSMKKSAPKRVKESRALRRTTQPSARLAVESTEAIQFQSGTSSRLSGNAGGELLPVACTHSNPRGSEGLGVPGREATVNSRAADAGAGEISPFAPLAPVAIPVPLLELTARSCRYIVEGEGEYALFCNAPRLEHGPYCPSHAARCYTAPERRRVT